ncbi:hypothetical protein K504DRAFT_480985 [Pleomassaria siparia CBS 279.74]|uniref:Uncharacterized protein n=1 Tax=Pleomassaria siparia CBS 279.74 TaxID=1314801 RepID=A0A6G1KDP2_9PLEO|nr:hypothetical protein K504DRAFT_480985 [Pleomassaria siparia CBS 279.74]
MPPIPIYKNAPIAPLLDGITPKTSSSDDASNPPPTRTTPASVPATTTAGAYSNSNPPPPQPGARPLAPTGTAQAPSSSSPAAPEPGYTATYTTTETRLGGPPAPYTIPPPSDTQLAGRSTMTATSASKPGPTTLNYGLATSQYQNEDAGGAVPTAERRSLEHPPGYTQGPDNSPYAANTSGGHPDSAQDGIVAGTAWGLLNKAGEALKKGEEAAWRAVKNK